MDVRRRPFSFVGDKKGVSKSTQSWHDALLGYVGGDETTRNNAEASMLRLAQKAESCVTGAPLKRGVNDSTVVRDM